MAAAAKTWVVREGQAVAETRCPAPTRRVAVAPWAGMMKAAAAVALVNHYLHYQTRQTEMTTTTTTTWGVGMADRLSVHRSELDHYWCVSCQCRLQSAAIPIY